MGFAEADPRQLAPTVGKTQVGITISAVPSPAVDIPATTVTSDDSTTPSVLDDSMARAESDLFGSLGFITHLPILRSVFADLRTGVDLTFGGYQIYVNRWGILRLTDRAQAPTAATAAAAETKDEGPAHTATPRVVRTSHLSSVHRMAHDCTSNALARKRIIGHTTRPTSKAPFQVYMTNTVAPTSEDRGKTIDPDNHG